MCTQLAHYDLYADFDTDTYLKPQRLCTMDGTELTLEELGIQEPEYDFDFLCTIRGYSGSAAELYAERNDVKFESIGEAPAAVSVFAGQSLGGSGVSSYSALFALGGFAVGVPGSTAVFLPKLRKKDGKSE